jgi:hypothetical protein
MKQTFSGGCQCGKVRYEVSLELAGVVACNCSRCSKLGSLLAFAPPEDFKLLSGADDTTEYLFNNHVIHHHFCKTCGIQSFARGRRPDGVQMVAINARCLDDVDVGSLAVKTFDGRSL